MVDELRVPILLIAGSAEQRLAWETALVDCADVVPAGDLPRVRGRENTDSILVLLDASLALTTGSIPAGATVIQVGAATRPANASSPPAEIVLPDNVTPRELAIACQLAGKIANLRWQNWHFAAAGQRLQELAHRDPLTALLNRRGWDAALADRLGVPQAHGVCLALIDLDHFKCVNDRFGHTTGDIVLKAAADTLVAELRGADVVARLGGDEFGLVLADVDRAGATAVMDRLMSALRMRISAAVGQPVTASAGFQHVATEQLGPDFNLSAYWQNVDRALQEAKRRGRDQAIGS
jgi:diguanylate cyclase (GGDEF)-like protein